MARHPACLILLLAIGVLGQETVTLERAASRHAEGFGPALEGRAVSVSGVVTQRPFAVGDAALTAIQDEQQHGLFLSGSPAELNALQPGDRVRAKGTIGNRGGAPVLFVAQVETVARGAAFAPHAAAPSQLNSFRYVGVLVVTEGPVLAVTETGSGEVLQIGELRNSLRVVLQRSPEGGSILNRVAVGDTVRVAGLLSQNAPGPPYDRHFELLVENASDVVIVERRWLIAPEILLLGLTLMIALMLVWWLRENRMRRQRRQMRTMHALSEAVLSAGSPPDMLRMLSTVLPETLRVTSVRIFLHNRSAGTLDAIVQPGEGPGVSVPVTAVIGPPTAGVAVCFRNRTLLAIPDTHRSPFFNRTENLPRSLLLVPMFSQSELAGILELSHDKEARTFLPDEITALQHLANQIATSLELLKQKNIQEQLYRTEKLAATGQLISGLANELRTPLANISALAHALLERLPGSESDRDLRSIALEAQRVSDIVAHLVSFARDDKSPLETIDVNEMLRRVIALCGPEWSSRSVQVRETLSVERLFVQGSRSQLEQVLLTLLVHTERSAARSDLRTVSIGSSLIGKRVLIEAVFGTAVTAPGYDPLRDEIVADSSGLSVGVCRGIVHSHGGELRFSQTAGRGLRFEIELPAAAPLGVVEAPGPKLAAEPAAEPIIPVRPFTALLVEPEPVGQRELLGALGRRGHRVVPVASAEEAQELLERMRFEVVFCAQRLPGLNWLSFWERNHHRIGAFVLVTEGAQQEVRRTVSGEDALVLARPIVELELDRVLSSIERRRGASTQNTAR